MPSLSVVEELETIEELRARGAPRRPGRVVDEFLQRREEALGDGVAPAIAPAAHAAHDPMLRQPPVVIAAGVLTSPIRIAQQALGRTSTRQRHVEGIDEIVRDALAHRPVDGEAVSRDRSRPGLSQPSPSEW